MRFYFHLHDEVDTEDEEGLELPDETAALRQAQDEALAMAAESVRHGYLDLSHRIEVTDEAGQHLFDVAFGQVVNVIRASDHRKNDLRTGNKN